MVILFLEDLKFLRYFQENRHCRYIFRNVYWKFQTENTFENKRKDDIISEEIISFLVLRCNATID